MEGTVVVIVETGKGTPVKAVRVSTVVPIVEPGTRLVDSTATPVVSK
jgi:hypothetical protein